MYEARGVAATSAAVAALSGARRFPLPVVAQQAQATVELLLGKLEEAPRLMAEMTESFVVRTLSAAKVYEEADARHAGLVSSTLRKLS